jgi:rhodanese-related sulfurtransferase
MTIVVGGVLLGVAYNALGLSSRRPWGLEWVARDRVERLAEMETVSVSSNDSARGGSSLYAGSDDPLAMISAPAVDPELPEIPVVGRPVPIDLGALKRYYDAGAALIIDARDAEDYAKQHIPGAVNMPYDAVITDPARLESLEVGGRPIITYCGGGGCETSLGLADELCYAGHGRVAVYIGGLPEWIQAGYPVDDGAAEGG